MEINREIIKQWMQKHHHTRRWLADKCNVAPNTVSNWLTDTSKPIPPRQMATIAKLIENNNVEKQPLVLQFSREEFEQIEKAAYREGSLIHEWSEKFLIERSNKTDNEN